MSTELVAVQTAVAEFDRVAAGLQDLQDRFGGVLYDVTTTKGLDTAKEARAAVRAPRFEVERVRKAAKAPILALGKSIDDRAKEITAAILKIEEPIVFQIEAEEARKEAEKQAKIDAEIKRVSEIQARIEDIRQWPARFTGKPSVTVAEQRNAAEEFTIDESFAEFAESATVALMGARLALKHMHAERLEHEAEQERIRLERAELDRLRAEQTQREAAERQRQAEENLKAQAAREAEETERRRMQAIEDAERAERIAAENAEIAARRAELDRQEHEARQAREKDAAALTPPPSPPAVAAAQSLRARPRDEDIADAVAFAFGVDSVVADSWLRTYGQAAQQAA
jgi:DNA repair exonuclease SbcCD ATPase subunit